MNTAIKMPLRSLDPLLVKNLQEKYPRAMVSIETEAVEEKTRMDEDTFWEIIALLDWGRKKGEAIVAKAIDKLSSFPEQEIFRFDQILAEKLFALDGEVYAKTMGWGSPGSSYFSVDAFLYSRCCAVANGKLFYEKVMENPAFFPKEQGFEPLLSIAKKAHLRQSGTDGYDFLPSQSYETFSNHQQWPGQIPLERLLKGNDA